MKAIILKVYGDYYVENENSKILALTKSLLGSTLFKDQNKAQKAIDKIKAFDLDVNIVWLELTPL
jgi:hypothetical protein